MSAQADNQPLIEYGTSPTMVCGWRFSCIVEGDSVDLGEEWTGTRQEADREARKRMLAYEDETGITPDLVRLQVCSRWRVRNETEAK